VKPPTLNDFGGTPPVAEPAPPAFARPLTVIEQAGSLWALGCDTLEIAISLNLPEHLIYNRIGLIKLEAKAATKEGV